MTAPDVHTLTGAYALDALDELERRQFERHLAECPECRQEVAELRATAVRLGLAVSEEPPATMKQAVLNRIAGVRQDPPRPARPEKQRRERSPWAIRLVSVAAAVAVAAAVGLGVVALNTQSELDQTRGELSQARGQANEVAELLAAQDLQAIPGTGAKVGEGSVMVSRQLNRGMLLVAGMPDQPSTSTYQAWAIVNGTPHSIGVLGPGGTSTAPLVFDGIQGVDEIAMTVEPAGGSAKPTTEPSVWFLM
ncbi:anti-sigma factor [Amycolatopsis acidicola]|uniref:Regulator of SigK n=1 Tax=Amycolatopsis acidicola TaxID=2596893 RepID=A0A5N0V5V5_9PSEU|nr:anti-sigma factor [Amycolatopsis acidicola]KAA9161375.1 anti-sigma factor [Amycolatopsis acidicola]